MAPLLFRSYDLFFACPNPILKTALICKNFEFGYQANVGLNHENNR